MRPVLRSALGAAGLSICCLRGLRRRGLGSSWQRSNFRGRELDMLAGPAAAAAAVAVTAASGSLAVPVAIAGAAAVGRLDDVRGARVEEQADKGLAGHARALTQGRVSAGALKVAGLAGVGGLAARISGRRGVDLAIDGACIAGMANLINLFDLRPGRAVKVTALVGGLISPAAPIASGVVGAALGIAPADLRETSMLGDAGANALGAGLGAAMVRGRGRVTRICALSGIAALTVASERVSFSAVIEGQPVLRAVDAAGRRR